VEKRSLRLPATVTVFLEPENREYVVPRPKTVARLLADLGLCPCSALVAREKELLTPDRAVYSGDRLLVRKVASSG
jgi:sulfur carrier protein